MLIVYNRHYFQFHLMFNECWLWQHFDEFICKLFLCEYSFHVYVVILYQFSNIMMLNVNMFCSFVVLHILNEVQAGLIVSQNLYERWQLIHR